MELLIPKLMETLPITVMIRGALQIPDGSELPDGTYDVDASVEDTVGNTASDITTDELTIDATAPTTPTVDRANYQ